MGKEGGNGEEKGKGREERREGGVKNRGERQTNGGIKEGTETSGSERQTLTGRGSGDICKIIICILWFEIGWGDGRGLELPSPIGPIHKGSRGERGTDKRRVEIEQKEHLALLVFPGRFIRNKKVTQTKLQ